MTLQGEIKKGSTRLNNLLRQFIRADSASGVILAIVTAIAMIAANSAISSLYFHALEINVVGLTIHHWINDGLMAVFFFVVGMEIKREILVGELNGLRQAILPVFAAIGGMVAPALIYLWINSQLGSPSGWAIPMATDIAFALGVLSLFGKRVPLSLKVFLLALAIVDDLGAVLVIATVYTGEIRVTGIYLALGSVFAIVVMRTLGVRRYFAYVLPGVVLWFGVLHSGVHATMAGVILGFLTPHNFSAERGSMRRVSPLDDLIAALHPWVTFAIMPIFALTNAGIPLAGLNPLLLFENPVSSGVFWGLLAGKPIGIISTSFITVFIGLAELPRGLRWSHLIGVSCLAGIGFTMAIFIADLSLPPDQTNIAKVAILVVSAAAALVGCMVLVVSLNRPRNARTKTGEARSKL